MARRSHRPQKQASLEAGYWNPEDEAFWESSGKRIANRNLWISVPCLLLAFAVWTYWSIITVQMKNLGFPFRPRRSSLLLRQSPD